MAMMPDSMVETLGDRIDLLASLQAKLAALASMRAKLEVAKISIVTKWGDGEERSRAREVSGGLDFFARSLDKEIEDIKQQREMVFEGKGFVARCSGCSAFRIFSGLPEEGLRDWWWEPERDVWSCPKCHAIHDSQLPPG